MLETLLRRDHWTVAACLFGITILAWTYLLSGAGMDMSMPGMIMAPTEWSLGTTLIMLAMWWIMMIAMMVPSAAPTVLLYSAIRRKKADAAKPPVEAGMFLAGYLAVWAAFSVVATALQWTLDSIGLMAMDMRTSSHLLGGVILIAAGLYQLTPVKSVCLRHCQSPVLFLSSNWRPGAAGAFRMGAKHGTYCLGCCWVLMVLLFVGGIMNLVWIAGLAIFVALEKLVARGTWASRAAGVMLALVGLAMLARPP